MARMILVLTMLTLLPQVETEGLLISHTARRVAAGEVVLVRVGSRTPLQALEAQWLDRTLTFYQVEPLRWEGLAPIDVAARPGRYALQAQAKTTDGRGLTRSYWLRIVPQTFPDRRITVGKEFADPPPEVLERISTERDTVEAILTGTTPERLSTKGFIAPVASVPTSSFGRRSIVNGERRGPHLGTDYRAATGTPVVAPARGRIALAADHYMTGGTIIIDHGLGVFSYLIHLSEKLVVAGTTVERGQKIALSGATGRVTGPHLHWAVRIAGARVDPQSLVFLGRWTAQPRQPAAVR
jgi:murein DD-endopeptidase MepM/ murein hydrolase activator NlpD